MSGNDEYYFENEDGDYYIEEQPEEEEEEPWEAEVRNNYDNGKRLTQQDKDGAVAAFQQCVRGDQARGRWTFKAHKSMYRACLMHRDEDQMLQHFENALQADYAERRRADVDKLVTKITSRTSHLSAGCRRRIAELARDYLQTKYGSTDDKKWFDLTGQLAQCAVDEKRLDDLRGFIDTMYAWCENNKSDSTRLVTAYAAHIQLCTINEDNRELRRLYQKASTIQTAACPQKVLGVIHESGGKVFLRQRQWEPAFTALTAAFHAYDLAGDVRKLSCLQYLVVAAMLSESPMNPFDSPDARSYQGEEQVSVMNDLVNASGMGGRRGGAAAAAAAGGGGAAAASGGASSGAAAAGGGAASSSSGGAKPVGGGGSGKRDVKRFMAILNDPNKNRHLTGDPFLYSLIEPMIQRVRGAALVELVRAYTSVRLSFVANFLATTPEGAEKLAGYLILEGRLQGTIDQVQGVLHLTGKGESAASAGSGAAGAGSGGGGAGGGGAGGDDEDEVIAPRDVLLQRLLDNTAVLRQNVMSRLLSGGR